MITNWKDLIIHHSGYQTPSPCFARLPTTSPRSLGSESLPDHPHRTFGPWFQPELIRSSIHPIVPHADYPPQLSKTSSSYWFREFAVATETVRSPFKLFQDVLRFPRPFCLVESNFPSSLYAWEARYRVWRTFSSLSADIAESWDGPCASGSE